MPSAAGSPAGRDRDSANTQAASIRMRARISADSESCARKGSVLRA
jgi:hypothetical protein